MSIYESIGSYFPIELNRINKYIYHSNAMYINTGRNSLKYILLSLNVEKLYLPLYSCEALLTPIMELNVKYEYYSLDNNLNPLFDFTKVNENEYFLYINYFGLKDDIINELTHKLNNIIIDNTQAFFSKPINSIPTFYSTRKFFGVADGALLCNVSNVLQLEKDKSWNRMEYLLARVENPSEFAFDKYKEIEKSLDSLTLMEMSDLTRNMLLSVDYEKHKESRRRNFTTLNNYLFRYNKLKIDKFYYPFTYPLWINEGAKVKELLIKNRIFLPTYWPNVLDNPLATEIEIDLVNNILSLPIDSRYSTEIIEDLACKIIKMINSNEL